jgi:mannose-6-phosphate isomerase-like protein (cupin superfamily)
VNHFPERPRESGTEVSHIVGAELELPMEPLVSVDRLAETARKSSHGYHEFLRVPAMSAGIYVLERGAADRQLPHQEDELYYVVRGRGRFHQGTEDRGVEAGDVLFVPAREEHRFHAIAEALVLLVVFAPAETD